MHTPVVLVVIFPSGKLTLGETMLKFGFAAICFFVSLVFAGISFFKGNTAFGVGFLFTAVIVLGVFFLLDVLETFSLIGLGASLLSVIWVVAAFVSSDFPKADVEEARLEAFGQFGLLQNNCAPVTPKAYELSQFGVEACGAQFYKDISKLTSDLSRFKNSGPLAGASDTINGKKVADIEDVCAEAVKLAYEVCSDGGFYLQEKSKKILLSRAKM